MEIQKDTEIVEQIAQEQREWQKRRPYALGRLTAMIVLAIIAMDLLKSC